MEGRVEEEALVREASSLRPWMVDVEADDIELAEESALNLRWKKGIGAMECAQREKKEN
jgi:hypothetical protein